MRRSRYVREGSSFIPRVLIEPWPGQDAPDACPQCGGSGLVAECIDEERFDVAVPCWACRRYCAACKKYVSKDAHECATKETECPTLDSPKV